MRKVQYHPTHSDTKRYCFVAVAVLCPSIESFELESSYWNLLLNQRQRAAKWAIQRSCIVIIFKREHDDDYDYDDDLAYEGDDDGYDDDPNDQASETVGGRTQKRQLSDVGHADDGDDDDNEDDKDDDIENMHYDDDNVDANTDDDDDDHNYHRNPDNRFTLPSCNFNGEDRTQLFRTSHKVLWQH